MLHQVRFCPDPLSEPQSRKGSDQWWLALWFTLSTGVHLSLGLALPSAQGGLPSAPAYGATEVFDIDPPPAPPVASDPPPAPTSSPRALAPGPPPPSPSPSPRAQPEPAAAVLTAHESAGPLDFTDAIVTGQATAFAGGATISRGGSAQRHANSAGGESMQLSASGNATGHDRSRGASVVGGFAWSCPFPPAADVEAINFAMVQLRIRVDARGRLDEIAVVADPGHGFAEAARRCAAGKQFRPGLDRNGAPVSSELVVRVRFTR